MSQATFDLGDLFNVALQSVTANRQELNALDGYNGNHGDNMVENLRLITETLQAGGSQPPSEALQYASQALEAQGRGGTSKYYAEGLSQAAEQLKGRSAVDSDGVVSLVQTLLGAIPSEGGQQQVQAGGSVLDMVMGLAGGGQASPEPPQDDGLDIGDVLQTLLPAGLAFLQAKQSGADTGAAIQQVLMNMLMGGQVNPLQAGTPRAAAGTLVAQSLLKALTGSR
jgi:hypothetical protein